MDFPLYTTDWWIDSLEMPKVDMALKEKNKLNFSP